MSLDYVASFGSYDYQPDLVRIRLGPSIDAHQEPVAVPDGAHLGDGGVSGRRVEVMGVLTRGDAETLDDWVARKAALLAAHTPGVRKLSLYGDRYLWASVSGDIEDVIERPRQWEFSIPMVCGDPGIYISTEVTTSIATSGTTSVSAANTTWYALPNLVIVVSSVGTNGAVTITNSSIAGSIGFTLKPDVTGTYTAYGSLEDPVLKERVLLGTTEKTARMRGDFLRLIPGSNILSVTTTGGLTLTSITCKHRDRLL